MSTKTDLAFVFPGQGSQSLGMLADLAERFPAIEGTFAEASHGAGIDLWKLVHKGPEAELNRTERTQPALLAAGVAVWRAWREAGGAQPALLAGHSLGEYTALVCAGAIDLTRSWHVFATADLWIGAVVGVAFIAAAIRLRRWRDEG